MRMLGNICKHAPSFVLSRNIERIAHLDNDVEVVEQQGEEGLPCTKNEHIVNPPMFYYMTIMLGTIFGKLYGFVLEKLISI